MFKEIYGKISSDGKILLWSGTGIAIATLPISLAVVAVNVGGVKYSDGTRTIDLKGKSVKLNENLKQKNSEFKTQLEESSRSTIELIEAVDRHEPVGVIKSKAAKVKQEIEEVELVGEELQQSQIEAVELVEEAIAQPNK